MTERVAENSLITLNYRVTNQEGIELVSTFTTTPATLQMGAGELAPTLEQCLIDLAVGDERSFELDATQAYGAHNPQLVQRVSRSDLPVDAAPEIDGVLQFASPGGTRFAGRVRQIEADSVLMDFNHPLAGQTIRFDAQIIGVM
jgi:FKBP-type peptidyl-prolyl cis-trans isomerase SlpA